jgi:hypothetical protein
LGEDGQGHENNFRQVKKITSGLLRCKKKKEKYERAMVPQEVSMSCCNFKPPKNYSKITRTD